MPTSLPDLEFERSKILDEFLSLGDLRPGSICAVSRAAEDRTATAPSPTTRDTIHKSG